jgi:hypothetical protein
MALESIGKRSLKPLKISILNLKRTGLKVHDNVITIASGPDLPYTDMEYQRLLSRNFQTSTKISILRHINQYFVHHILNYFNETLKSPLLLKLNYKSKPVKVCQFSIMIIWRLML